MGGAAPGWYPDYEAPPGHQRYWDGSSWTERRSTAPEQAAGLSRFAPWLLAAVAVLVAVSAAVLMLGDDEPATSRAGADPGSSAEPSPTDGSSSSPSPSQQPSPDPGVRRSWQVDAVLDGSTLQLANGAEVRLAGITGSCATEELAELVDGQSVALTRRGPDKDADGRLLRYVERNGLDVGKRLIQKGWAKASEEPNARREIYRRIDERSPDAC